MVTDKLVIGKIEVLEDGQIQIREDRVILDDGVEVTRLYHRSVLEPGDDVKDKEQRIQLIASVIWTPELVAEYKRKKGEFIPPLTGVKI